jgi:hypothetical protein
LSFAFANQRKNRDTQNKISTPSNHSSSKNNNKYEINSNQDYILHLQKTIGNQAVQRLMGSNIKFDFSKISIQPKLKVSQPGDVFEKEADRVAEQVIRMPESPNLQHSCTCGGVRCNKCQVESQQPASQEHEHSLQHKHVDSSDSTALTDVPPIVNDVLHSAGQPLSRDTREFMEPRFGHDFSQVRVHTDSKAAESARDLNANSYTVGKNIVFGAGQFLPGTWMGWQLLAHELTHVVQQQQQSPVQVAGSTVSFFNSGLGLASPLLQRQTPQGRSPPNSSRPTMTAPQSTQPLIYNSNYLKDYSGSPEDLTKEKIWELLKEQKG